MACPELNNVCTCCGNISEYTLNPSDFDLANYSLEQLAGEGPEYNANASRAILAGTGTDAHNAAIIVNVAALLYLTGKVENFKAGAQHVVEVLKSGRALNTLNTIVEQSHKAVTNSEVTNG